MIYRQCFVFFSRESHLTYKTLHDNLGPVVRTGPQTLEIASLTAYNAIYGVNHNFEKGSFYDFGREPGSGKSHIFSIRGNLEHRAYRRPIAYALASTRAHSYDRLILDSVQTLISTIQQKLEEAVSKQPRTATSSPIVINVASLQNLFIVSTIFEVIHGVKVSLEEEDPA